jgi:hypothetical protein
LRPKRRCECASTITEPVTTNGIPEPARPRSPQPLSRRSPPLPASRPRSASSNYLRSTSATRTSGGPYARSADGLIYADDKLMGRRHSARKRHRRQPETAAWISEMPRFAGLRSPYRVY